MNTITLEQLKNILILHEIKPADHYTAAAGAYYGKVTSWDLGDAGFLIWHRGIEGGGFVIHKDDDDLASWLELDPLHPLDAMLRTANVRGVDKVPEADPTVRCDYVYVLRTLYFRGGSVSSHTALVPEDERHPSREMLFTWIKEAQTWIEEQTNLLYVLSPGEIHAPTYKIVAI